ncbi:hypothetical protein K502DRAFT_349356 [Neoconidiobolus thromboides FSU 785]|nr:hypothetical protein K502DRAFT_349356 [Neoconidiobolus thromboides FSU 785]
MNPVITSNVTATNSNFYFNSYQLNNKNDNNTQYKFIINRKSNRLALTQQNQESMLQLEINESHLLTADQLKFKKIKLVVKMSVIVISYILCLLPDLIIGILNFAEMNFMHIAFYSNCLVLCLGFTSSCFILLIHQPIQRYFLNSLKLTH